MFSLIHIIGINDPMKWQRPLEEWIKCNVDDSFLDASTPSQAGWVLRDNYGTKIICDGESDAFNG